MRVLLVYNDYKQRGGEAVAFENERDLLLAKGHAVRTYMRSNDETDSMGQLAVATRMIWSQQDYRAIRTAIREHNADIVHVHNFFLMISPAVYYAAAAEHVPVVQTMHNYRLLCPSATFFRDGKVCEDCMGKFAPYPGVVHACYRDNRKISGAVAAMLTTHRMLGTWNRYVTRYIALTPFTRDKYIEGGLPAERVVIKPNFLSEDPGYQYEPQDYALFVGRLSHEKGVATLMDAWKQDDPGLSLKIAGDGPLMDELRTKAEGTRVEFLGSQPRENVYKLMKHARMLLFPSIWYECLPYTILEAFAIGTPIVVSKIGSIGTMIRHNDTGLHAEPGDPASWSRTIRDIQGDSAGLQRISRSARTEFEQTYATEASYQRMIEIYEDALGKRTVTATR
ncbi:glycosyltransferase family 4 protein [bacterium]|nr:glycosyltransferase family 4 protein [bacterium]